MVVEDPPKVIIPEPDKPKPVRFPRISAAVIIAVTAGLIVHEGTMKAGLVVVAYLVVVGLVVVYLIGPLLSRKAFWLSPSPEIRPIELDEPGLPPDYAEHHRATAEALGGLGFAYRGHHAIEKANPVASSRIATFVDRAGRTTAAWAHLITPRKVIGPILGFTTRYVDGSEVSTSNNPVDPLTPPVESRRRFAFPGVDDPARLLALHRRALADLGEFSTRAVVDEGDPVAYLRGVIAEEVGQQVKDGYFRLERASGLYRLTWKGAYLMAWRQLWPLGPIRRAGRRRLAARRLRDWEPPTA